jgi:DNA polymerase III subunit gamma/tau
LSHTALARKYRPRRFAEVATQEHVSETLRRAVESDRVGHAYLFCGPRGVGKTTLARVLAMALNCPHREASGEPCGECEDCRRIWSGTTSLDVVEIDAATNRGVDDARQLRERAMYAPSEEARFKVYIVDEAHMLTREAWNALLKILEEPPPRVIFIFATTEPQKIEQTAAPILSRCQRFDFHRVGVAEIVDRLREVLEWEGSTASDEALRIIARKADGGMRDALSLTDQILALSDDGVDAAAVRQVLGVVEEERYLELFDLLTSGDRAGIFSLVEELLDQGYDLVEFYHGLLEALRILLRIRVGGEGADLPEERRGEWADRAGRFQAADLIRMLGMASELETTGSLRRTNQPRVLLELLLLRFSYLDRTLRVEELLQALGGGEPLPDGDGGSSSLPEPAPRSVPGPASGPTPGSAAAPEPRAGPPPAAPSGIPADPPPSAAPDLPGQRGSKPADAPSAGAAPATPRIHSDPIAGWRALVRSGEGVPAGLSTFLRASVVRIEEGVLVVDVPPGPALERLQDHATARRLEQALTRHLEAGVPLRFRKGGEVDPDPGTRITPGAVQQGRLKDLLEREPGLRGAVEALDLEIVD